MNITNNDFETIKQALEICADFRDALPPNGRAVAILDRADAVMVELNEKRLRDNARIAGYMAKKRTENKNYAR